MFREKCASCHQAHGLGHAVGPDLSAEFQRAEETIIRDVLAPSDTISPGYVTYTVATEAGQVFSGLLVAESPTSLTLRQAEGKEQIILRKDVDEVRAMSVSMMPEDLPKTVAPRDLADLLAWLRRPPTNLILVDENRELIEALNEGAARRSSSRRTGTPGRSVCGSRPRSDSRRASRAGSSASASTPGRASTATFASRGSPPTPTVSCWSWPPTAGGPPPRGRSAATTPAGTPPAGNRWRSPPRPPREWTVVTRDLWEDFGDFTLTGIAPTAMGGDGAVRPHRATASQRRRTKNPRSQRRPMPSRERARRGRK